MKFAKLFLSVLLSCGMIQEAQTLEDSFRRVLVYGSFMNGNVDFMIDIAATIASKGPQWRKVY